MQIVKPIIRLVLLLGVACAFVALTAVQLPADVCVYKPPKVRRICGVIVDPMGFAVPRVQVTILRGEDTVAASTTDEMGEFDFDGIQAGKYKLDATISGFQDASYQLTVFKPTTSCKHALRIEMLAGGIHCGGDIRRTNEPLRRKR